MPKKIRALVTGGAGFIGTHLCGELLRRGFQITVIDNFSTAPRSHLSFFSKHKSIRLHEGSILDVKLMKRLIRQCDIVYHLAAAVGVGFILSHAVDSILTNIEGTGTVLRLADQYRKKVLIASSSEVYGKHGPSPMREDDDSVLGATSVGRWSYAAAKAIDEFLGLAYFKERKLPVVIVRFFNIVGPGQLSRYGMVLPKFIRAALEGKPLKVHEDGSQTRSFTYVEDAVRAVVDLSLEKKAEGEVVNVGNNHPVSIKALALMVKKTTHSVSKIQYVPYSKAYGRRSADFEDMPCRVPDIAKIKKLIGYRPKYDLEKIIRNTLQYTLRGQMEK